jgi:DNA end-binding protein Ku
MGARAMWKGILRFGGLSIPVKLYSAVEDRKVHLRLLHAKDQEPVKQVMIHPGTGKPVPFSEIRKGYDTGDGEVVLLSDEELESLAPKESRDIELVGFVDPALVNHQWYDRPYYLGPDGDETAYFAFACALEKERKEGVARWTMRKKQYVGALLADQGHFKLITLHHAGEVVDASSVPRPKGRAAEQQELRMAEQLLNALSADFDPHAYRDEYRKRVLELVETKARGGEIVRREVKEKRPKRASLAEILEASLKQVQQEQTLG